MIDSNCMWTENQSRSKNFFKCRGGVACYNSTSVRFMELSHILEELAYDIGGLPRDAIEAAIAKRQQITPYLLAILNDAIDRIDEIIEDDNYQGHLYAIYLLAQFREEAAYPLLIQLFSFPGEIPHAIVGDVLTEDLSRILASVCGDKIEPMKRLIQDRSINEYVRAACQTSLAWLVGCGRRPRQEIIDYFTTLFKGKLERRPSFVWDNLVSSSCLLYPEEVYEEIGRAFEEGLVDSSFISLEEVAKILATEKDEHLFHLFQSAELIDDTVSEMEKWIVNI